jgi:hypothetical protein
MSISVTPVCSLLSYALPLADGFTALSSLDEIIYEVVFRS